MVFVQNVLETKRPPGTTDREREYMYDEWMELDGWVVRRAPLCNDIKTAFLDSDLERSKFE